MQVLSDAQWKVLEPLIEAVRPHGKTPPRNLRRTIEAILWRHHLHERRDTGIPGSVDQERF